MPTIEESRVTLGPQWQVAPVNARPVAPVTHIEPGYNSFLRCPMPLLSAAPDALRQFYRPGIPQSRVLSP